jgi:predicted DNA-binding transcriptional regulator AlpA
MVTINELIKMSGYKKEFLIKKTGIPRNKFYKSLKDLTLLNDSEVDQLASALGYNRKVIDDIINAGNQASGLHH